MKNNRLTNNDLCKLRTAVERIQHLASLETASFDHNPAKDQYIKDKIKPYMMWFELTASTIEEILDGKDPDWCRFR